MAFRFGIIILMGMLLSCARFEPKPLSATGNLEAFETRTLDAPSLKAFLAANRPVDAWPLESWDLASLTLAALYYHPEMQEARAALGVADSAIVTAGQRPNPTLSVWPTFDSTTPGDAPLSPWILGLDLDFPIETAGKRGHRIVQARHLSEAARQKIVSAAWQVRSRVRQSLLDLYAATETEAFYQKQLAIQEDSVQLLTLQLNAGAVSPFEVSQARIALSTTRLTQQDADSQRAQARAQLAEAVGVPLAALDGLAISFDVFQEASAPIPDAEIRRQALLNRADIRGALARYEASQAALQLEIAKQYPDIHLAPGYEYDQSEHKWAVGLSLELPILNQNQGPIAEAEARRTEAAARFDTLQTQVIGELDKALAGCRQALQKVQTAASLVDDMRKREQSAEAMYRVGETSRLPVATARLELIAAELADLNARIEYQRAVGLLEDAMQRPADLSDWPAEPVREKIEHAKDNPHE
jgi:outer membrane protein TolC